MPLLPTETAKRLHTQTEKTTTEPSKGLGSAQTGGFDWYSGRRKSPGGLSEVRGGDAGRGREAALPGQRRRPREWTSGGGRMLGMPRLDLEGFNILEVY